MYLAKAFDRSPDFDDNQLFSGVFPIHTYKKFVDDFC